MPKVQALRNGKFRAQFRVKGVKYDATFATPDEAQAYIDCYSNGCPTFKAFAEDHYKETTAYTSKGGNTHETYKSRLKEVYKRLGNKRLDELTVPVIDQYVADRKKDTTRLGGPPAGDTIRLELTTIQNVMRAATKIGWVTQNPVREVDKPKPGRRRQRVSETERLNLMNGARGEWPLPPTAKGRERGTQYSLMTGCRFLLILSELGCRAMELGKLPILAVDFANMEYYLEHTKNTKSQRRPLSPTAAALIREQMISQAQWFKALGERKGRTINPYLLFSLQSDPRKPYDYQYAVELVREYGLVSKNYHSQANRRELVSSAIENEVDYETIMAITGHSSVDSMKKYDEALKLTATAKRKTNAFFDKRHRDLAATAKLAQITGGVVDLTHLHEDAELAGLDLLFQTPEAIQQQSLAKKKGK